jgi:molybdopterin-guanine dinucleotide biosynthesis protein A
MTPHLYLLAGGKSSRFGSDKARHLHRDEPLLLHILRTLSPHFTHITLVLDHVERYRDLTDTRTIADRWPEQGPLAALATALLDRHERAQDGWIALCPCDLLDPDPTSWLALNEQLNDETPAPQAIVYRDATEDQDKKHGWHPLTGLYHTDARHAAIAQLTRQERALWRLLETIHTRPVTPPLGWRGSSGLNTPS